MRFIGDLCLEQEHDSCTRPDCECGCHDDKRSAPNTENVES